MSTNTNTKLEPTTCETKPESTDPESKPESTDPESDHESTDPESKPESTDPESDHESTDPESDHESIDSDFGHVPVDLESSDSDSEHEIGELIREPVDPVVVAKINDLWNLIINNDHEGIRSFIASSGIECDTSYTTYCELPDCGCSDHNSIKSYLIVFPNGFGGFDFPIKFDTIKLLFDIGFLKRDDVDFLEKYMRRINCDEKFDMLMAIVSMYDKTALKNWRSSDYNETLLHVAFGIYYGDARKSAWEHFVFYLIYCVGIDVTVKLYDSSRGPDQDGKDTVMAYAICKGNANIIRTLHKLGMDVNEFDGDPYNYNRTPIMAKAVDIGKLMKSKDKHDKIRLQYSLDTLYETCTILKELGYDFSVVNKRGSCPPYKTSKKKMSLKYDHRFADFLKIYGIPSHDPRFCEFL